jgi:hypothetical protein
MSRIEIAASKAETPLQNPKRTCPGEAYVRSRKRGAISVSNLESQISDLQSARCNLQSRNVAIEQRCG